MARRKQSNTRSASARKSSRKPIGPKSKAPDNAVAKAAKSKPAKVKITDNRPDILRPKRKPRRLLKWVAIFILILLTLPVLATFAYKPGFVHPLSTLMAYRWINGEKIARTWVPLQDVSPFVIQSVISSEDGQFCFHKGVDWNAVNTVIDDLMEGESPRGASTIPMQTMKNVFLWSSRSYVRKLLEVPLALMTDAVWGKRRMLEIYLNIAEWGPGIYGIEAAAQHHFKRSSAKLSRKQAALLAVTLPNPILRNPARPGRGMKRLARLVEKRARASGAYIKCVARQR